MDKKIEVVKSGNTSLPCEKHVQASFFPLVHASSDVSQENQTIASDVIPANSKAFWSEFKSHQKF